MEHYTVLYVLLVCSVFRGALTCQGRGVEDICRVLADVPDWKGLAGLLEVKSNDIEANCARETAQAACCRRELVHKYCDSQPSGSLYKVSEDIAKALDEMGHKRQAEQLKRLKFGIESSVVEEKDKQTNGPETTQTKQPSQESAAPHFTPDVRFVSDGGWTENREFIIGLAGGLVAVMTIVVSTCVFYFCTRDRPRGRQAGEKIQTMAKSGKGTQEYEIVKSNLGNITKALQLNAAASQSLRQKFIEKGWLGITATATEMQLVTLALGRIEQDVNQYEEFIAMLRDIEGMDQIVKKLTGV